MTRIISPQPNEPMPRASDTPKRVPDRSAKETRQDHPSTTLRRAATRDPSNLTADDLESLQQTIGNRAVGRLLTARGDSPEADEGEGSRGEKAAWWDRKVEFQGAEKHKLYFRGEGENAELMMASAPTFLKQLLDDLTSFLDAQPGLDEETKETISEYIARARKLSEDIDKLKYTDPATKTGEQLRHTGKIDDTPTRVARKMNELADVMGELDQYLEEEIEGAPRSFDFNQTTYNLRTLPPTKVKWTQTRSGGYDTPKVMDANPLSLRPGAERGSQPYEESRLWLAVKPRNHEKEDSIYIRGHLLNHHLFGPGANKNLVPITSHFNRYVMGLGPEQLVKQKVLSENQVVRYRVEVEYGGHDNRVNLPPETYLPTSLKFRIDLLKFESGGWVFDQNIYNQQLPHPLPDDNAIQAIPKKRKATKPAYLDKRTSTGRLHAFAQAQDLPTISGFFKPVVKTTDKEESEEEAEASPSSKKKMRLGESPLVNVEDESELSAWNPSQEELIDLEEDLDFGASAFSLAPVPPPQPMPSGLGLSGPPPVSMPASAPSILKRSLPKPPPSRHLDKRTKQGRLHQDVQRLGLQKLTGFLTPTATPSTTTSSLTPIPQVVLTGPDGRSQTISGSISAPVRVGRGPDSVLQGLTGENLSRRQIEMQHRGSTLVITNVGKNSIYIGGTAIKTGETHDLLSGQRVFIVLPGGAMISVAT